MNKTIKSLLTTLLLITWGISWAVADKHPGLKVFSMNLHCFKDNWQERFETVLLTLSREDISVYAFQELCIGENEDQVAYLSRRIRELHPGEWTSSSVFTHRAWDKYDEYLLIMARGENLPVRSELLPVSPLQRGFVAARLKDTWFVNTHLEYHTDNSAYRLRQLEYLADEFGGQAHVIMGDFNSSPDMNEQSPLMESFYEPHFPGPTFPASRPELSIDGFWLSPELKKRISRVTVSRLFGADFPGGIQSDHLGVMLEIGTGPEPE